ncbi:c-type cytochrome biogenesis protein CcmI [Jannaschia sp. W003]|uniref:c-type cytochrome biogenesis protein CcmI n=1 Tax=Jannaschia sp. W003 TaxID=2867012 RepID=UPI0021A7FD16|nr:c-type cytochrome biogenesis protein CcmI [Jannaschia sp. W003]UWQ20517.1 c-type cytochrome biogenesis protein CcmI [Jannaschia sp. W003]
MFWIAALLLAAAVVALLVRALATPPEAETATADVVVYRDQLRELERDVARGTLAPEAAEAARAEVARRLLAADAAPHAARRGGRTVAGGLLAGGIVVAVAMLTYLAVGAPGYPDLPLADRIARIEERRAARPAQAVAESAVPVSPAAADPETLRLAEQLRAVLEERPDDLEGWRLRVRIEAGLGDLRAAWRAQERVIALLGDAATATDHALLAELMIGAAGGFVSLEAERALAAALRLDPRDGSARYHAGLMFAQGGRPDRAWPMWRRLVADSAPGDPWLEPIYAQIEEISQLAGQPTPLADLPRPGARGPSEADVTAAADLDPEARMEMIGGMVDGLAASLASDGGPPADWARLITSLGVLGRGDAAAEVYAEARTVFADDPGARDVLRAAAERAGIAP